MKSHSTFWISVFVFLVAWFRLLCLFRVLVFFPLFSSVLRVLLLRSRFVSRFGFSSSGRVDLDASSRLGGPRRRQIAKTGALVCFRASTSSRGSAAAFASSQPRAEECMSSSLYPTGSPPVIAGSERPAHPTASPSDGGGRQKESLAAVGSEEEESGSKKCEGNCAANKVLSKPAHAPKVSLLHHCLHG